MADTLSAAEFARLRRLPPEQAMAYMRGRVKSVLTFSWQDLWQTVHARRFTVSRLARLDLLHTVQVKLEQSVAGDLHRRDWIRDIKGALADAGWWGEKQVLDPATGKMVTTTFNLRRLHLIYDTNTRQAASAGQWARFQRTKRALPYIRYVTMRDDRVRPLHASWDNVTLPVDDPFWQTHMPPNGWNCRCRVIGVTQAEYDKGEGPTGTPMKKERPDVISRPFVNRRTGEISEIPVGIDPGFAYNAGVAAREQALLDITRAKLQAMPPKLRQAAEVAGLSIASAAATFAEEARLQARDRIPALPLGPIHGEAADSALPFGVTLRGRWVGLDQSGVRHALKNHGGRTELARGQVPITTSDLAAFWQIFNAAHLEPGKPTHAPDGMPLMKGTARYGAWRYEFVVKIRKDIVTLYSLFKRPR